MRGVVMKITENRIVVLCDDGKFRNLPLTSDLPALGQRIDVLLLPEIPKVKVKHWVNGARWAAAVASTFLLVFAIFMMLRNAPLSPEPVAMVAIEINSSIELMIDAEGSVDRVNLDNENLKGLITEEELLDQPFYTAVQNIVAKAEQEGFLDADADNCYVFMSVVDLGEKSFDIQVENLPRSVQEFNFEVYHANQEKLQQANKMGLTLNKLIVYEHAKEKGLYLNVSDLRSHSIADSLAAAGVDPVSFFDHKKDDLQQNVKAKTDGNVPDYIDPVSPPKYDKSKKDIEKEDESAKETKSTPENPYNQDQQTPDDNVYKSGADDDSSHYDDSSSFDDSDYLDDSSPYDDSNYLDDSDHYDDSDYLDDSKDIDDSEHVDDNDHVDDDKRSKDKQTRSR